MTRRIAHDHQHTIKIKGRVRARGVRGAQWYGERQVQFIRKKVRTQNLWLLHLSGDWHPSFETMTQGSRDHHMMRCMLVSSLDVQQAFANGTRAGGALAPRGYGAETLCAAGLAPGAALPLRERDKHQQARTVP